MKRRDPSEQMWRALDLAWASLRAGSLGVGAVIAEPDGTVVATGRNRVLECDAGEDVLANCSLAHAEMNALAKLPINERRPDLVLWTTLQPCIQCLAAIRLSVIRDVRSLSPDPLFRGLEAKVRDTGGYVAADWPRFREQPADEYAVFGVMLHTCAIVSGSWPIDAWTNSVPTVTAVATEITASGELAMLKARYGEQSSRQVVESLWAKLGGCVDEIRDMQT